MNKYDVALDLETKNSLSIIAKSIQPNSWILEFGPATGRLTKYLKEQLNCKVYIAEIDENAYNKSLEYAVDGSCGDIEKYQWVKKFEDLKFDYIIFADVLEHLKEPDKVVKTAKNFLKEDGLLVASVPNIAHDSIIINLLEDTFQYNKVGLLDDTHIHFFTYHSLKLLFENNGYSVIREEATYLNNDIGEFPFSVGEANEAQKEVLADHKYGHVYQFVFFAGKSEDYEKKNEQIRNIKEKKYNETFGLYINTGRGFSENEKQIAEIIPGFNKIKFDLIDFKKNEALRFDFGESGNCIITLESVKINEKPIDLQSIEGNYVFLNNNKYYFNKEDPYLSFELCDAENIEINFIFKKVSKSGWYIMKEFDLLDEYVELSNKYVELSNKCNEIENQRIKNSFVMNEINRQLMIKTNEYNNIANSKIWKMTKPIRKWIIIIKRIKKTKKK